MSRPRPTNITNKTNLPDYIISFSNGDVLGIFEREFREFQKTDDGSWNLVKITKCLERVVKDNQYFWVNCDKERWINIGAIQIIEKCD